MAAWNSYDSVAWAVLFAKDAEFIHILGGYFQGREAIERGHRTIFDTIYKGSQNKFKVEKALGASGCVPPSWRREVRTDIGRSHSFRTRLLPPPGVGPPDKLVEAHPYKGDTPVN